MHCSCLTALILGNASARRPARQLFAAAHAEVVTEVFLFREKLHNQDFCNFVKQSLSNQPIPSYRGRYGGGVDEWILNGPHDGRSVGLEARPLSMFDQNVVRGVQ